jgi:archaellum component FlaC
LFLCFFALALSLSQKSEELKQHAKNNLNENLKNELLQKDEQIRSIEMQVKDMSKDYELRNKQIKESEEKYNALNNEFDQLKIKLMNEQKIIVEKDNQIEEIENRHNAATSLVRSLKSELVRMERRVKDMDEESSTNLLLSKRQTIRLNELELKLSKTNQENESFKKKALQATTILQQLGSLTSSP